MNKLKRFQDWNSRLEGYIVENKNKGIEWGKFDCCLFVCNCIQAMTGVDTAYFFRGKYSDKEKAHELLKEFSGGEILSTVEKIAKEFSIEKLPSPLFAQRGDIVYCNIETCLGGVHGTLGIISNNGMIAIPGKDKIEFLGIEKAEIAWKI